MLGAAAEDEAEQGQRAGIGPLPVVDENDQGVLRLADCLDEIAKDKKLIKATLTVETDGEFKIKIPSGMTDFSVSINGMKTKIKPEGDLLSVWLQKGSILKIKSM